MIKKIKENIVSLIIYLYAGICFGLWAFLLILVSVFHTGAIFERLLKTMCKFMIFICGIRVTVKGVENYNPKKQYIIMMNHVNIFDSFLAYSRLPGKARAIEEESHFKWPIYGWMIKRIGLVPINRKSGLKAMSALKKASDIIKEHNEFSFGILPEGTRTVTGKLGEFKKGGFLLAIESGLDILPIIQTGSFYINNKVTKLIRPGKIELIFEKPIPSSNYSKDNVKELIQKTRSVFLEYVY
jgi:1-acyl-sn-glycerol-3-phosphate acyltransferase